ncbi:hypothetical protein CDAR_75881 [Caerostris darwini]|uniref:Uncharacterized protein n=1 Tax=Caerostris darwini TaxID=1538125 RepID=A0AAV4W078_9ARAC|nr:hypothetical protein CDAR_75881 [Caerostris darwini]
MVKVNDLHPLKFSELILSMKFLLLFKPNNLVPSFNPVPIANSLPTYHLQIRLTTMAVSVDQARAIYFKTNATTEKKKRLRQKKSSLFCTLDTHVID